MKIKDTNPKLPSNSDWLRLAAYIDGEGAILLNKFSTKSGRREMWIRVVIANTDPRLPKWCQDTFGGTFVAEKRSKNPKHSDCYRWHVSCTTAEWVLRNCLPFFLIKKEQAEIALKFQDTLGGPGIPVSETTRVVREELRDQLHSMKRYSPLYKQSAEELAILETRDNVN